MGDVADGIFDLAVGERTARPVGETRALVDRDAEPAFYKVGIADLFGLADCHHRYLGVEDGMWSVAGGVVHDLHILPAGMEDLEHILVGSQQVEQR